MKSDLPYSIVEDVEALTEEEVEEKVPKRKGRPPQAIGVAGTPRGQSVRDRVARHYVEDMLLKKELGIED